MMTGGLHLRREELARGGQAGVPPVVFEESL